MSAVKAQMGTAIRFMRLWHDGQASAIWVGYSTQKLYAFIHGSDWSRLPGRVWIEYENAPATRGSERIGGRYDDEEGKAPNRD